jgi:hypothetical protein
LRGLIYIISLTFLFVSCSPGQSFDDFTSGNTIQSQNDINPLFEAESLSDAYGDGKLYTVTLKVPLTKDSLGSYDFSDVMENEDLDDSNRSWLNRFCDTIMYNLANLSFKFGARNKYSYTTGLEFPEIDSRYVKEVRIKKLFFSLEDCAPDDLDCVKQQASQPPSLNFLKSFFLNVSPLGINEENLLEEGVFKEWSSREFNREFDKAFGQKYFDSFEDYFQSILEVAHSSHTRRNSTVESPDKNELFNNLNVARLRNTKKLRRNSENTRDEGRIFIFRLKQHITKYRKAEIKRHFKQDIFKDTVKDLTILGNNLVVELFSSELRESFFRVLSSSVDNVDQLDVNSFEGCSYENCASIDVNGINLVPLLEKTYKLKFDTFLELRFLQINDFLYNGFVEIEIKLDLPL